MNATPHLSITGLTKRFGATDVLLGIDLEIAPGEFVGLMGPNGAGKSTLIKVLDGIYRPTKGSIELDGTAVTSLAERPDVGFIHQDLGLVDALSITDNLRLGERPMRLAGPLLNRKAEAESSRQAIERIGLDRPVSTLVGELSPGEKTLVAVARALSRGARILFVDEATSTLPVADARRVMDALALTVEQGATVIMVTHKLAEILDVTRRVVVILDGRIAADAQTADLDRPGLVRLLASHEGAEAGASSRTPGPVRIALRGACGGSAGPVDLEVESGVVVGVTGLPGSGLHDVAYLASGTMAPTAGEVHLAGARRPALVPPHRESQGGFPELSVRKNMTLSALDRWRSKVRLLSLAGEAGAAGSMATKLAIRPANIDTRFGVLSGGNKQKAIFGRALLGSPEAYVLCEPTRGVDVSARAEIYGLIRKMRDEGAAVLVVTSDEQDLFAVCDRIGAVRDGCVGPLRSVAEMNVNDLEALL